MIPPFLSLHLEKIATIWECKVVEFTAWTTYKSFSTFCLFRGDQKKLIHKIIVQHHFIFEINWVFPILNLKLKISTLGLSFQKQKFLYSSSQPTGSRSWAIHRRHNCEWETQKKTFSSLQSYWTDSSWIHSILLIKLIQYKIGKTRMYWLFIYDWKLKFS